MTLLAETAASGRPSLIVCAPTLPTLLARLEVIVTRPPEVDTRDGRPVARCSLTRHVRKVPPVDREHLRQIVGDLDRAGVDVVLDGQLTALWAGAA